MCRLFLSVVTLLLASVLACAVEPPAPLGALAKMPVKEITVFKDGYAFVLHEGAMPTDAAGNVILDYLPAPVLGTFWPYSHEPGARLVSVTAGHRTLLVERTCLTLRNLVEANPGAEVSVTDVKDHTFKAKVVGLLQRSTAEVAATAPAGSGEPTAEKSNLLQLKTQDGTLVMPFDQVRDVKFLGPYKTKLASEERRNVLTLHLDWGGKPAAKSAQVGMFYLQKGVRWIPSYQVDLDGTAKATVKLEATLLNELCDLQNVAVNLVVGVPTFQFKDTLDPIALNQKVAQLSPYFDQQSAIGSNFSNSIMTQVPRMTEVRPGGPAPGGDLGPEVAGTEKGEDLFVFSLKDVTLAKGQRMVLPVSQAVLEYRDVFVLDIPFAPPADFAARRATLRRRNCFVYCTRPR